MPSILGKIRFGCSIKSGFALYYLCLTPFAQLVSLALAALTALTSRQDPREALYTDVTEIRVEAAT